MDLEKHIVYVPDFPAKGVLFRDLNPFWENQELFQELILGLSHLVEKLGPTHLVALEARGFIIASALAYSMKIGLSLIRKKGKLPGKVYKAQYGNEYTFTGEVEMQSSSLKKGARVLFVDDILATGKSTVSCIDLIKQFEGVELLGALYVLELKELGGREFLNPYISSIYSLIQE